MIIQSSTTINLQVGPAYGRRTLNGLLRSEGIVVGEQRVRSAMTSVTPVYIQQRQQHTYQLNPVPYYAEYFGHKMHIASFPGSRAGEEEREPGTHCSRMRQVPLVTCILLRCTKITVNSSYLLKGHTA